MDTSCIVVVLLVEDGVKMQIIGRPFVSSSLCYTWHLRFSLFFFQARLCSHGRLFAVYRRGRIMLVFAFWEPRLSKFRVKTFISLLFWFSCGIKEAVASSAPILCSWLLIPGCAGWFFESVVGRIFDSMCWLRTVVGFEFYLPVFIPNPMGKCTGVS